MKDLATWCSYENGLPVLTETAQRMFHPASAIFPLMNENDLRALAKDIKENTLREPIWKHEGQIIDGRNRYIACHLAEVGEPAWRKWNGEGSLTGFIRSMNLERRHLTDAQRAAAAVKAKPFFAAEAKERQRAGGRKRHAARTTQPVADTETGEEAVGVTTRKSLADAFKVTEYQTRQAMKIQDTDPELLEQVQQGMSELGKAAKSLTLKKELEKDFNVSDAAERLMGDIQHALQGAPEKQGEAFASAVWTKLSTLWLNMNAEEMMKAPARKAKDFDPEKAAASCLNRLRNIIGNGVGLDDQDEFIRGLRIRFEEMLESIVRVESICTRKPPASTTGELQYKAELRLAAIADGVAGRALSRLGKPARAETLPSTRRREGLPCYRTGRGRGNGPRNPIVHYGRRAGAAIGLRVQGGQTRIRATRTLCLNTFVLPCLIISK